MRLVLALSAIAVGLVVSSCAVGVRDSPTEVTKTSATLNGKVLSSTGGPGSWYIEYGPTEARAEKTPTRTIDFEAGEIEPVSEPVDELEPGTIYHYAVCAEDGENPGEPFCSPDKTFRTQADIVITLTQTCLDYPLNHSVLASVSGLPPFSEFFGMIDSPNEEPFGTDLHADENGNYNPDRPQRLGPRHLDGHRQVRGSNRDRVDLHRLHARVLTRRRGGSASGAARIRTWDLRFWRPAFWTN